MLASGPALLLARVRNRIGHLCLNRPQQHNALSLPMVRGLAQQLQAWAHDPEILAVVLRGGEQAFCAGADIRALHDSYRAGDDLHQRFFEEEYALDLSIHQYPKPVLALMDGLVIGAGMGLMQGAALRAVTERVTLAMPEVGTGYFPDGGASHFLPRLPGQLGIYLGITGASINAADALYARLADWCLPVDLLAEFDRCLDHMTWNTHPQEALRTLLATLGSQQRAGSPLQEQRQAIDQYFALADLPAIRTALQTETSPKLQDWAQRTLWLMDRRSPLAMAVSLKLLRAGRALSLADCFELELHLGRTWFATGDIMEGIRALLIDKDHRPQWNPPRLTMVNADQVNRYFAGFKPATRKPRRSA